MLPLPIHAIRANRRKRVATAEFRTLKIYNHETATVGIAQDVPQLCVTVEDTQFVHCLEYRGDCFNNICLVNQVRAVKQGPPSPAEKHKVHENTAVLIVWPDQVDAAETDRDVLPLDSLELVVDLVLVLHVGTVQTLHTLGNKRIPMA